MKRNWKSSLAAGALVLTALAGAALAAGADQGSQADPLITLSYLNDVATPALMKQVDAKLEQREAELAGKLQAVADEYAAQVEDKLSAGGSGNAQGSGAYQVVTLSPGQQLIGEEGCEFLLRSGSATVVSDSAPGLIDLSGGGALSPNAALTPNHLYLGTADGRGVQAGSSATLMVRGSYVIR